MGQKRFEFQDVDLTPREYEVLRLVAAGLTGAEIAKELYLSEKTIEHMLGRKDISRAIYPKIGVKNRAEAAAWYAEMQTTYYWLQVVCDDYLRGIFQARMNGEARLAIDRAEAIAALLREEISCKARPLKRFKLLLRCLANILFEQLIARFEISLSHDLRPFTDAVVNEIKQIAKVSEDKALFGLADYAVGMTYYITGQHQKSLRAFESALAHVETTDQKLNLLRAMALDWAYLGETSRFYETEAQIRRLIEAGDFLDLQFVGMALEGLGRGRGLLNRPAAFDDLEAARRTYNQIKSETKKIPLRYVQLARSDLEVMRHLQMTADPALIARGQEGLRLAREYGYPRYARRLEHLLNLRRN